uniref:BED-type domain-containing protein n=1 Tax=Spongospora subterranea TaxID=70186 RepID=A0A0H5R2N0_9EUKA|eukprot:CRZ08162.1 hypothetical protein [Spongospora subterranea]
MLREELEKLLASEESECQYMIVKSKKRADCWKQFGEVVAKSDLSAVRLEPDSIAVACLSCQQVYAYHHTRTGSSSLNRHICSKPESSAQQDIRSMIKSSSSNSRVTTQQKKTMTSMLALMCCTDLRPFQIVEGAGFRSAIQQALVATSAQSLDNYTRVNLPIAAQMQSVLYLILRPPVNRGIQFSNRP